MALNDSHANGGVLIHAGECIILYCNNVSIEFNGQDKNEFKGNKYGRLYLTTHRVIFNNKNDKDSMQSFSFPFSTLKQVELKQPTFGANYIQGMVQAQPNGNWLGIVTFKISFKSGGAIEFGQAMLQAASLAKRNNPNLWDNPPPYTPVGSYQPAAPPAYSPSVTGYYGWIPPYNTFPTAPPANSVYSSEAPPPYPGLSYTVPVNQGTEKFYNHVVYYDPGSPNEVYVPAGYQENLPNYNAEAKKFI